MKSGYTILPVMLLSAVHVSAASVTYTKDVAPILNKSCVGCHRAGEAAPMAFTSYKEVRPWAKAIRQAVLSTKMPPWLADPAHGQFKNDRRMAQQEKDTISAWVMAGAPEGKRKHLAPAPEFLQGWNIGKPDMVFDIGTEFEVPADGVVPYKYFRIPSNFKEDMWVEAAEIRPDKRGVVHHVIVFMAGGMAGAGQQGGGEGGNLLVGFAPGDPPMNLEPGTAKLVKAGTVFNIQMHYTPNGTAMKDRSYFGLRFSKTPPVRQAITGRALNFGFKIPPGDPNYEVKSSWTAKADVEINGFMPHMHVRGKDFEYTATYPDGRREVVLKVPRYDFNWQLAYELEKPLVFPKGSRIDCVAHFDNSPNNKANPDPTKEVKWGDQTWEEMMIGWFTYTVPVEKAIVSQNRE
ncbi:MAG: thiol-disulfide isomerase [Acidobacteriia bacterium]|nr:thiol-disulfide isomerase [Terriglobia bacterium]